MLTDWDQVDNCLQLAAGGPEVALKIVVFDDADYEFAEQAGQRYPQIPLFLQPGNHTPPPPDNDDARIDIDGVMDRMHWLVERVTADQWFEVRVLPQLHVLLWGNKRGV
jgi:7-carboxy-7-deazaguanine synthase